MDYKSSIDLLKELIAIPSFSKEEKARADFLCRYLRELGFEPQRVGNNLWCTAENIDDSKPNLLLNSHIDTVRPSDSWTRRPFVPQIEGDRLYGLGSNDAGAALVCLIRTFWRLSRKTPGIQIPSAVWLFSSKAATTRGKASALPLSVWHN